MAQPPQPIFILADGTQRTSGRNAQKQNIMAAKAVAEAVRTTLGPKGMDKMIVDSMGDVIVTNDGVTILKEMQIENPAAKMMVEIAKTQEAEVGDGTTTAVVIAGELLKQAEVLLEQDIHPTVLARGFRLAGEKVHEYLKTLSEPISEKDKTTMIKIAETAMTGKGSETAKEHLAQLLVEATLMVLEKQGENLVVDRLAIKIEKKVGESVADSELIKGIVIDKERVHAEMPETVDNARILLIESPLEIKSTEADAKIQINTPEQMQAFLDQEEKMLRDLAANIKKAGANVVFCQKGIDDLVQHFLAQESIYAVRRVKKTDMESLAQATGARIMFNVKELKPSDLGKAGTVEQVTVGDEHMTYVRDCKNPKSVTLLVRGSTEHVVDEAKRAMEDAVGDLIAALKGRKVVAGAGSIEIELVKHLRKYADSLSGREQLAVEAFAKALEVIPRTLAENAGLDPIDVLTELKAAHDKGDNWAGIDVFSGKTINAWKKGIIEPLRVKTQAMSSATEVAIMILRIDDVIIGSSSGGHPGGMGGMDPSMMGM